MKQRIIVAGASSHGRVVAEAILQAGKYRLVGFLDSGMPAGESWYEKPLLGPIEAIAAVVAAQRIDACVVAIGHNWARKRCAELIRAVCPELTFAAVVHPRAHLASDAVVREGTVILDGAIVCAGATIGRHCLINTGCQLDHESVMEDFASLAPGVVTGGKVRVGEMAAICMGALVLHERAVGAASVVGAGAVVVHNIPENCVAYGTPARIIRTREPADAYL